jgi:hypothetical protein
MESQEYEMVLQTIYRTRDSDEAHGLLTFVNLLGIIHVVGYGLQASDPRDHIFDVLNMAADVESLGLVPDYTKSCEKAFIEAVMALIKKGEIVILGWTNAFGSRPPSMESTVSNLLSWVPDWRLPISSSIGAFTQFLHTGADSIPCRSSKKLVHSPPYRFSDRDRCSNNELLRG